MELKAGKTGASSTPKTAFYSHLYGIESMFKNLGFTTRHDRFTRTFMELKEYMAVLSGNTDLRFTRTFMELKDDEVFDFWINTRFYSHLYGIERSNGMKTSPSL